MIDWNDDNVIPLLRMAMFLKENEDGVGIGLLQESSLTNIINDSDAIDLVDLTTELVSTLVATIAQAIPDSIQNEYLNTLGEVIKERSCGDEVIERIIESERKIINKPID